MFKKNLLPFVKKQLGYIYLMSRTTTTTQRAIIQQLVLSWFVRYKCKITLICVLDNDSDVTLQVDEGVEIHFLEKIGIIVRDIEVALNAAEDADESYEYEYAIIRDFTGSSILIQSTEKRQHRRHLSYVIEKNPGYYSLVSFIQSNTRPSASKWEWQVVICEWLKCYGHLIRYEGNAKPLPLSIAIDLLEAVIRGDKEETEEDRQDDAKATRESSIPAAPLPKKSYRKCNTTKTRMFNCNCRTRSTCVKISNLLTSVSRSKSQIQYTSDMSRHLPGQPPKLKRLPALMFADTDEGLLGPFMLNQQIATVCELEGLHSALIHLNILSPRDQWEEWIDDFKSEDDRDPAFMCLLIILMSSSTADNQLAHIIPRLFSSGLTSAKAVVDIVQQYGLDSFCLLLSESGRFYQNAERILNAADYFVQRHDNGRIPRNITVNELCTLFGVGYKTANIVITTAFRRVDGIPSDIHVIRWSALLGWCPPNCDGLKCSKLLEGWLPKTKWESINPIFGAFGQLLVSDQRGDVLEVARQHPSPLIRKLFTNAAKLYNKSRNNSNSS
jgi:endonuclease III